MIMWELILPKILILLLLKLIGENVSFLQKDCRNHVDKVRRLQLGEGDAMAILKYFETKQAKCDGFFLALIWMSRIDWRMYFGQIGGVRQLINILETL